MRNDVDIDELVRATQRLVDLIDRAPDIIGFDQHGNGPCNAIEDNAFHGSGPIRRAAEAVRRQLLDYDVRSVWR